MPALWYCYSVDAVCSACLYGTDKQSRGGDKLVWLSTKTRLPRQRGRPSRGSIRLVGWCCCFSFFPSFFAVKERRNGCLVVSFFLHHLPTGALFCTILYNFLMLSNFFFFWVKKQRNSCLVVGCWLALAESFSFFTFPSELYFCTVPYNSSDERSWLFFASSFSFFLAIWLSCGCVFVVQFLHRLFSPCGCSWTGEAVIG